ncbi:MAG: 50S ribosomal protein L17 [Candidatus Omnitrophica bacterium]|nr:50S ribosomal protein L17 [Candidatus Omnitrophota bacterium]
MRHQIAGNRLSRNRSLRRATLRDLAKAALIEQRICTTRAKAKQARRLVEKLITLGKKDTLAARRRAFAILCDHASVSSLFKETAPRFKNRLGGYTRIIPFIKRLGDNADMVFLELTEKDRAMISGQKLKKEIKDTVQTKPEDAQTKAVEEGTKTVVAKPEHSKADVKTSIKVVPKPTGLKKLFQRKVGGE